MKNRNLGAYKRMREATASSSKRFFVFANEHHRDTFVERRDGESAQDRNDRAIRTAASWYDRHLEKAGKHPTRVVLLTNDKANREKALGSGLLCYTTYQYAASVKEHPALLDRLSRASDASEENEMEGADAKAKFLLPEHLALSVIQSGIKSGKVLQGTFQASRDNRFEGYVSAPSLEQWVLVQGTEGLSRAVHGDTVALELFPEEQWSRPSEVVAKETLQEEDAEEMDEAEVVTSTGKVVEKSLLKPTGRVVGIIRRNWRPYCGTLYPKPSGMVGSRHVFVPADRRIPRVCIHTRQAGTLTGKRIVVSIDSWPRTSRLPQGHFVRELGDIGDKETENEVLLLEHEVPHHSFPAAVLSDLPHTPWSVPAGELGARRDLRHLHICSVDPPGCTDIDDALHCRSLENGNYEVGVHIADVTHFVRPGTALDKEAANRGTTVYLSDRRIDMVPELLSSNLCSLHGGEERLAFSCIWELSPRADVISTAFAKSVIRSRQALTYAEAQMKVDDQSLQDPVSVSLRRLNELAKVLKLKRVEAGALTLASPEVRFEVDSETHDPVDLQMKELKETNSLVEEFMLLANISVAKHIYEVFPHCALLRRHPSPPLANYDILVKAARSKEIEMSVDCGKSLASSLDNAVVPSQPYFNTMLRIMTTRCMMQALYFCSGVLSFEEFYHYGLATAIYTHFTSPIRRYSDILVHRLLAASVGADSTYQELLEKQKTQQLCSHLNHRHKMAQHAARASLALHTQLFFRERSCVEEGFVLFLKRNAIQVLIPKYGLEGNVFFDKEDGWKVTMDDMEPSLTVEGVTFHLFDRVEVKIAIEKSGIQQSSLRLYLVSPVIRKSLDNEQGLPPSKKQRVDELIK